MTKKEEQYIRELGQLYVKTGEYEHVSCGGGFYPKYKPVNVLDYIKEQEYNENLNTYMKFRTAQRYAMYSSCGGSFYEKSSSGMYVKNENGKYINIRDLESKLKPEDIEKRLMKLKSEKYKNHLRFSKIQMEGGKYFAWVEDPNGCFVYDHKEQKFIDLSQE